jgi:hypothetical protein
LEITIHRAIYFIGVFNVCKYFTEKIPDFEYLLKRNVVLVEYRGTFGRTGLPM